jgi:hypothetical protein
MGALMFIATGLSKPTAAATATDRVFRYNPVTYTITRLPLHSLGSLGARDRLDPGGDALTTPLQALAKFVSA